MTQPKSVRRKYRFKIYFVSIKLFFRILKATKSNEEPYEKISFINKNFSLYSIVDHAFNVLYHGYFHLGRNNKHNRYFL